MSNGTATASACLPHVLQTDSSPPPRSLATCVSSWSPVLLENTEDLRTWLAQASPANHSARHREGIEQQKTCGQRHETALKSFGQDSFSAKTFKGTQLTLQQMNAKRWVTKPDAFPCPRRTWVLTTFGKDSGYLHTPTTMANYCANTMQKWPTCREFVRVFGRPSPVIQEWLMGWPIGWSDTRPLAMGRFLAWLRQHGDY